VIVGVPVCAGKTAKELQELADKLIVLHIPPRFWAVGQFYWNFDQISDEEVIDHLLNSALKTPQ
jgi:predicted phosphoribosyltransferase